MATICSNSSTGKSLLPLQVAEQLFRPLVSQMIHWFTRNTQYESPDTIALLEAILVGWYITTVHVYVPLNIQ